MAWTRLADGFVFGEDSFHTRRGLFVENFRLESFEFRSFAPGVRHKSRFLREVGEGCFQVPALLGRDLRKEDGETSILF